MTPSHLRLCAALCRWFQTVGEGPFRWGDGAPEVSGLWLVRFKGPTYSGPFDRHAYLCLSEAEAKMVVGTTHGPQPVKSPLRFDHYINSSYAAMALQDVLADEHLCQLLQSRLRALQAQPAENYERATESYGFLEGGSGVQLLLLGEQGLMEPANPRDHWPDNLRWGEPQVVWNGEGLAGVMDGTGKILVPCQYHALDNRLAQGRLEAFRDPLPEIQEPLDVHQLMRFSCDVIEGQTGRRINPPGVRAVWRSLDLHGNFVAVRDAALTTSGLHAGFMDRDGAWLGRSDWADLRSFNEKRAAVFCGQRQCWGYVDEKGHEVIEPRYARVGSFNRGKAFVQDGSSDEPRWRLIDRQGHRITGPWAEIDHAHGDNFVVQALDDAGSDRWSLLDASGACLLHRIAVPADAYPSGSPAAPTEKAAYHLSTLWRSERAALAEQLRALPLKACVERFRPTSEGDLRQLGIWGRQVRVLGQIEALRCGSESPNLGTLKCYYPVTLSVFNLTVEGPVTFQLEGGREVCIGVPWGNLELLEREG